MLYVISVTKTRKYNNDSDQGRVHRDGGGVVKSSPDDRKIVFFL